VIQLVPVPNPQTGPVLGFAVELQGDTSQLQFSLFSVAMVEVGTWVVQGNFTTGWNHCAVSTGGLPAGLYYVLCGPVGGKRQAGEKPARLVILR
jgi:hypothetical protein